MRRYVLSLTEQNCYTLQLVNFYKYLSVCINIIQFSFLVAVFLKYSSHICIPNGICRVSPLIFSTELLLTKDFSHIYKYIFIHTHRYICVICMYISAQYRYVYFSSVQMIIITSNLRQCITSE